MQYLGAVTNGNDIATKDYVDTNDAGKQTKITASGLLKGDGSGGVSAATAGTDYATPAQVNAKYTKPSGGIPKTDLASAVQTSLGKADTALQEHQSLAAYRTAAAQDVIDAGKQAKITASGLLKGDGSGGVSAATAGTDYATPAQVNAKYTKPSGGIPASDLAAGVALPAVTASDNGKVLRVVSGAWTAASLPSAAGVSF